MKTLHLAMIMTLSLFVILLGTTQHAYADTCSAKLTSYNAPQFYLLSDEVFAGTVQHIDNTTDHQWKVYFTVDKIWRGTVGQKPLIVMTNDLQGCGYSIVQGEKYLVYTNGYPPFFNTVWSKPYADAQGDIAIIDDPKFQSDEKAQEELNKKLLIASDAISNLMGSKMGTIPFNSVGVDVINSTLDIGIDSTKAVLSEEEYEKKIKDIVGDIPIKIIFGQNVADAPIVHILPDTNFVSTSLPPLKQFKSGIKAEDVKCSSNFILTINRNYSPACVTESSGIGLLLRGWAIGFPHYEAMYFMKPNATGYVYVNYFPNHYEGSNPPDLLVHLYSRIYKLNSSFPTNEVNATAKPELIHTTSNTMVEYAVTASDTNGVYWLSLSNQCAMIPIVMGIDPSHLTTSDLQNPSDSMSCPPTETQFHVSGISNMILKLILID